MGIFGDIPPGWHYPSPSPSQCPNCGYCPSCGKSNWTPGHYPTMIFTYWVTCGADVDLTCDNTTTCSSVT